jgi:hypothetical protein
MGVGGISIWQLLVIAVYILIFVLPFWHIYKKAGFSPWLSLLMLIPLVNLIMLYVLAFAKWPSLARSPA